MESNSVVLKRAFDDLKKSMNNRIIEKEFLSRHTTLNVGGPAKFFVRINSIKELKLIISFINSFNLPYFVIGNGSNLLVSDSGFNGVVIKLEGSFLEAEVKDNYIKAGAGISLPLLVNIAYREGLSGISFAAGIPGTLGAAILRNAGAHGNNVGEVVDSVEILSFNGKTEVLFKNDIVFGYRSSSLINKGIITSVTLKLASNKEKGAIKKEIQSYLNKRKKEQPVFSKNAGCFFKNPTGHSAAKLIEESGCKGLTIGGAQVSSVHSNFIVNFNNASASDIYRLLDTVRDRVKEEKGIVLETEVICLGDFESSKN
ncbi:MAG: UDP-N-acetylmuramate dehydrogenase [Actinobacteria bacterium]|nr:UDP-N-acetylmuramate dehydrogenase [Actinomycetota bacterium]